MAHLKILYTISWPDLTNFFLQIVKNCNVFHRHLIVNEKVWEMVMESLGNCSLKVRESHCILWWDWVGTPVKITEYNFSNKIIQWRMSKSTKDSHTILCYLLPFLNSFELQKVGQGYVVQFSQCYHSTANVRINKDLQHIFVLALTVSEIYSRHTHTDTETDKPMAVGEILQICLIL